MKEAIRKLEDQCWIQIPCDFDMDKGGLSTIRTVFDRKKFAELIVRECMMLVEGFESTQEVALDEYVDYEASAVLKEHFGVEE